MRRFIKNKIKGGALYYAIVVILLLNLFAMGFIMLNRLWFQENVQFLKNRELNDNLDSAEEWLVNQPDLVRPGESAEPDLFGDSSTVKIEAENWGLLRLIRYSAGWRNLVIHRTALYSGLSRSNYALYLVDNNKFLSLVGKTVINGDCSLPALGFRAGEMDGVTYTGKKLINGRILKSGSYLPKLSGDLKQSIERYFNNKFSSTDSISNMHELFRNPVCSVSFGAKTRVYDCGNNVCLQNISLSGNIIVSAIDTITILPTAQLNDILLFANTIIVLSEVKANFQVFARKNILVGADCVLRYPSFLVCFSSKIPGEITLGKNSVVNGGILIDSTTKSTKLCRLAMNDGNRLTGMVYVNGEVGFAGQVDGSLYCDRFYIETPRAYYENFLSDGIIDSQSFPSRFGSFVLNGSPDKLKFVKRCL